MTDTNKALEAFEEIFEQIPIDRRCDLDNTFRAQTIRAALSPNAVVIPREKIKPYMLEHYKDWRDTDQEIDRHNEEGMTDLAEILALAILSQYREQK